MPGPLQFGRVEIVPQERLLRLDGVPAAVGARAFDVLLALVERRERLVPKQELLELVWAGLVVEENNLQVQISALRKLLGAQAIATVPGRGYRFAMARDASTLTDAEERPREVTRRELSNLAFEIEPLIGRDAELEHLCRQIAAHRVVSVVGGGGMGKTRLARAAARQSLPAFEDGVWWVDLAACAHGERVAEAIAQATGTAVGSVHVLAPLSRALAAKRMLLVLDNCEHLLPGVVATLGPVLAAAPGVRVLVTSQLALHLPGEHVLWLEPLGLPPAGAPAGSARSAGAVALFAQRASAADHRFVLADADLPAVVDICERLDGNALAIELAAARVPQLGLVALRRYLADPLRLLRSEGTARPARQQSLRATLEWSCALLSETERTVLHRLGVFVGSFRLESALRVAGDAAIGDWDVLDALGVLVERSLVHLDQADPPRYRLRETMRLFATEMLEASGMADLTRQRHGQALAQLAASMQTDYRRLAHPPFVALYADDYRDMESAFERACARRDPTVGAAAGGALAYLDSALGVHTRLRSRMAAAYALVDAATGPLDRALLLGLAVARGSTVAPGVPRLATAAAWADAWQAAGDARGMYVARCHLAEEHAQAGNFGAAQRAIEEATALEQPDWPARLLRLRPQAQWRVSRYSGEWQSFRRDARRMIAQAEAANDTRDVFFLRWELADMAAADGDLDEAMAICREVVAEAARLNQPSTLGHALLSLSASCLLSGQLASARDAAARALPLLRADEVAGLLFDHLALIAVRDGEPALAARLLGHADHWYMACQLPLRGGSEARVTRLAGEAVAQALGAAESDRLRAEGRRLPDNEADLLAARVLARGSHGS